MSDSNKPLTSERKENEALSTGAEKAHLEGNVELWKYIEEFGDASRHNKALIESLFSHGKPGHYVAKTKTLIEKTAEVTRK